jgi:DNA-binding LacI/PurR family transcriptional regulator
MDREGTISSAAKRPVIGFLLSSVTGPSGFQDLVWQGMVKAAREKDVNALFFPGGWLGEVPNDPYDKARNLVYELADREGLDGLVVDWSIGSYITPTAFSDFCDSLRPIPIVSLFGKIPGYPHVRIDNKKGMRDVILHLVQTHGFKRIAFIKGWKGHTDAEERFAVYADTLKECGIAFDAELVFDGDFMENSGRNAAERFSSGKAKDIQAVVASNDAMAFGALAAFQERGKAVPQDIALTGFDDSEQASVCFPPLTTVRQPFDEIGKAAIGALLDFIAGKKCSDSIAVPALLSVRESCGCPSSDVAYARIDEAGAANARRDSRPEGARDRADRYLGSFRSDDASFDAAALKGLLEALLLDVEGARPEAFLSELRNAIKKAVLEGRKVGALTRVVSALGKGLPSIWFEEEKRLIAQNRISQAYIMAGEADTRAREARRIAKENAERALRSIGQNLITSFDREGIRKITAEYLGKLGIPSCVIRLYDDPRRPAGGVSSFLTIPEGAFDAPAQSGAIALPPRSAFPAGRRFLANVLPLSFKDLRLGYAMLEVGPEESAVYDALQTQIGSSLMGSKLLSERKESEIALGNKAKSIQELARPMVESIGGMQGMIKENLGSILALVSLSNENKDKLKLTNASIDNIDRQIRNMSEIVDLIEDFSASVQVLAINTSIEATHAGAFGKGFAVIAAELRKLSNSIESNTERIARLIEGIRKDTGTSTKAGDASLEAFVRLEKDIMEVADTLKSVTESMEDLSAKSSSILSVMNG